MAENPAEGDAERRARKLIRRHRRDMRVSWARGYLDAVCAMLGPGDTALDCGANMGEVTARLAATGARVIAYEPDPFSFERLQARFETMPEVTLVQAALGAREGTAKLRRAEGFARNPEGASVRSTILEGGRGVAGADEIEVPVLDFPALLDRLAAERGELAFVKMDIEGAELEILERLLETGGLGAVRAMVVETHERKFKALRPRFARLRETLAAAHPEGRVRLDWI